MVDMIKETLLSDKDFANNYSESLKKRLVFIKNNFIDFDDNMYLTVNSLIEINNKITGSNILFQEMLMHSHMDLMKCIWTNRQIANRSRSKKPKVRKTKKTEK